MKGLSVSVEEKAARYDAALEYAHCLIEQCKEGTCGSFHRADLDKMFPELMESDDERIRKDIVTYLKSVIDNKGYRDKIIESWIAWLEQGEQKPEVDQHSLPVSDDSSLPTFNEDVFHPCTEEVYEQRPAWSEDELKILNEIIEDYEKANKSFSGYQARINWLKSLKDRVQSQPKQEWSEEDEYHKRQILRILKDNGCSQTLQERTEKWIEERLKSLRPQSQWKPSDSQMASITCAVRKMKESACYDSELVSLFNDLKKLRGEEI